jgi:anti-sigma B factor antagonist
MRRLKRGFTRQSSRDRLAQRLLIGNEQCHDGDRKANVNKMTLGVPDIRRQRPKSLTVGASPVLHVAAINVEACMQAYDCGWHRHASESRIQIAESDWEHVVTRIAIPPSSSLEISVDQAGKDAMMRLSGRVDVDSSPDLRDRLRTLLSVEPLPQTIIVDLAGVPYIETSGIATLIESLRSARHHQISFRLQGLSGAVLRLFQVTGVLALFAPGNPGQSDSGQEVP